MSLSKDFTRSSFKKLIKREKLTKKIKVLRNRLSTVWTKLKLIFQGGVFKLRRRGGKFYFNNQVFDLTSLMPHIGMALLLILVMAGSALGQEGYFSSYKSMQQTILTPGEMKVIALSVDDYTPFIQEKESSFIQSLESKTMEVATSQGYVESPQIMLTEKSAESDIGEATNKKLITRYHVKGGDTVSGIASKFGISTSTLRWANDLSNLDYIKPGQSLTIPTRNGVFHKVEAGESLSQLVNRFDGDLEATLKANNLGKGDEIFEGQKLVIVGGEKSVSTSTSQVATTDSTTTSTSSTSYKKTSSVSSSSYNRFPYGWCTWYVASRRDVPWSGNAGAWLANARAMGYSTGYTPAPGAIVVTNESWVGHVAVVEAVYGNSIKISEMNGPAGWGVVGTRMISASSYKIQGYIY